MNRAEIEKAQQGIINSINTVVDRRLREMNTTSSMIGVVVEDPIGFEVRVRINQDIHKCIIGEHLHHWIQKDDVVVVQDLYNDKKKLTVIEKTGHLTLDPQLVFEDPRAKGNYVSGVDKVYDDDGNVINYATVRTEAYGPNPPNDDGEVEVPTNPKSEFREVVYDIIEPVSSYILYHDLNTSYPNVIILDRNNTRILAKTTYDSSGIISFIFDESFSGKIIINGYGRAEQQGVIDNRNEDIRDITDPITSYILPHNSIMEYPNVVIVDSLGKLVLPSVSYESKAVNISFDEQFIGKIILNGPEISNEIPSIDESDFEEDVFIIDTPINTYTATHSLDIKYPIVTLLESNGDKVLSDVVYNDTGTITINFEDAFSGKIAINGNNNVENESIYNITEPVMTYMVTHNKQNKYPNVTIVGEDNHLLLSDVTYGSGTVSVDFGQMFIGKIIIS